MIKKYLNTLEEVIKALKEGKVIKDEDGYTYKMVDGFIISKNKDRCCWLKGKVTEEEFESIKKFHSVRIIEMDLLEEHE